MKICLTEFKKLLWLLWISFPVFGWAGEVALQSEEPTETEIRRLQTQLNILDTRITDPTIMEQRKVLQDKLFDKIRRLHDTNRQEKDLVGGIEAKKHAEAIQQSEDSNKAPEAPEKANSEQPKFSASSSGDATPVAPLKVTPPQPRTNVQPASPPPPRRSSEEDGTADIYRSIINYSSTNSTSRVPAK
jgi:hypothetical protein